MLRVVVALVGVALAGGCVSDMAQLVDDARVTARIGVLANTEVGWITETRALETAFRFYRQNGVDAVVIAGKVTRNGYRDQREVLAKVWQRVFRDRSDVRLITEPGRYEANGFAFAVASNRPYGRCDVVTFHGEGKRALTDELCFYPRKNRAIAAGSMSGVTPPRGFEGVETLDANGRARPGPLAAKASCAAQGLLVSAYGERVVVRRLDFTQAAPLDREKAAALRHDRLVYAEDVAEPWVVDAESGEHTEPAPEFWDDTRVQVCRGQDKEGPFYTVIWPAVQKRFTGARARSYEVEAQFDGADAAKPRPHLVRKSVLSDGFFLAEERDVGGVKCVVRFAELPSARGALSRVVFAVTPIGAYGKRGRPVRSEPVPLPTGSP